MTHDLTQSTADHLADFATRNTSVYLAIRSVCGSLKVHVRARSGPERDVVLCVRTVCIRMNHELEHCYATDETNRCQNVNEVARLPWTTARALRQHGRAVAGPPRNVLREKLLLKGGFEFKTRGLAEARLMTPR